MGQPGRNQPGRGTSAGTLFLVSGPSGAGKDAVIDGVRKRLGGDPRFVFPLRTITRPEGFGGEIHVAVTPAQYDRLRRRGNFALCWGARGLNYAIPASIEVDLQAGRSVVVNVAPAVFAEARARYPKVAEIWIAAAPEIRRRRLLARGRETPADVAERLRHAEDLPPDGEAEMVVNEGALEAAIDSFIAVLEDWTGSPAVLPSAPGLAEQRL